MCLYLFKESDCEIFTAFLACETAIRIFTNFYIRNKLDTTLKSKCKLR